jgi:ABC-2 type transport system ATP-binding protein
MDAAGNGPALELRDVHHAYGEARALAGVSLTVSRGEIFCYLGPNGAGKTTTIKVLTGLIAPTAGEAFVCGHDIRAEPLAAKARLGYVPESGALFEKLTPREHLGITGRLYGVPEAELEARTGKWLGEFDLLARADQRIHGLSKGLKQRVCWASALLHDPEVLVLDEPLNGLDVEMVTHVKGLLGRLVAEGRAVFYSSHLVDVVEKLSTRVGVLHEGRLVAMGSVAEVMALVGSGSLEEALPRLWRRAPAD